jgi:hypothetical protein
MGILDVIYGAYGEYDCLRDTHPVYDSFPFFIKSTRDVKSKISVKKQKKGWTIYGRRASALRPPPSALLASTAPLRIWIEVVKVFLK